MAINTEVFKFHNELNKRQNLDSYQTTFPMIQALEKIGSVPGDVDHENAIGNYSAAAEIFEFPGFTTADAYIRKIHMTMVTSTTMTPEQYGNLTALTNGIVIAFFQKDAYRIVSPAIKSNSDYQITFNEKIESPSLKFGEKLYTATLTLDTPLIIKGGSTDALQVQVNDDFSSLVEHRFVASGWSTNLTEFQGS